mmetsp:Transcript_11019/g.28650  ORF Transcript_11019/g.28650 Transcript_11019/m.28650 type:complete len:265 (-) Transcript_11019:640-1434(-)
MTVVRSREGRMERSGSSSLVLDKADHHHSRVVGRRSQQLLAFRLRRCKQLLACCADAVLCREIVAAAEYLLNRLVVREQIPQPIGADDEHERLQRAGWLVEVQQRHLRLPREATRLQVRVPEGARDGQPRSHLATLGRRGDHERWPLGPHALVPDAAQVGLLGRLIGELNVTRLLVHREDMQQLGGRAVVDELQVVVAERACPPVLAHRARRVVRGQLLGAHVPAVDRLAAEHGVGVADVRDEEQVAVDERDDRRSRAALGREL